MRKRVQPVVAVSVLICLIGAAGISLAQQSQNPSPSPSPGGGITSGTAPIETTLLAYRALASDVEAVSHEIVSLARDSHTPPRIVIGTAADVTAFAQWRAIMVDGLLLDKRALAIHGDFPNVLATALQPLPGPQLSVTEAYTGNFRPAQIVTITLTINNAAGASATTAPLSVTDTLPKGWVLTADPGAPEGYAGAPWTCAPAVDHSSVTCTRPDFVPPGSSSSALTLYAKTAGVDPAPVNTVSVTGGGAATVVYSLNLPAVTASPVGPLAATPNTQASTTTSPPAGGGALSPFTSTLPSFVSLATTLAQAFSVNQTLTATQNSMTDAPLINMVARQLNHAGLRSYVPSVYDLHLFRNGDLKDTYLWKMLELLEKDRAILWKDIADAGAIVNTANAVAQNQARYSAGNFAAALRYAGQLQSLITSAQTIGANIDAFETTLFGGQSPQASQNPSGTQSTSPGGTGVPTSGNPTGTTGGLGGNPGNPQNTNPGGNTANPQSANPSTNQPPNQNQPTTQQSPMLLQIIGSDLLAHELWDDDYSWMEKNNWDSPGANHSVSDEFQSRLDLIYFLTVHALESGGSELVKTNMFYGQHIFFSGGAVMTFGLYKVSGAIVCSGFTYNYEGNVREKRFDQALRLPQLPAIVSTDFACRDQEVAPPAPAIAVGMTVSEVMARAVSYRLIGGKGQIYTYEFVTSPSKAVRVVFKDGRAIRVMLVP
jgi:hypothetical protein